VEYGDILWWLWLWFLMATIQRPQQHDFWSISLSDEFDGDGFN